MYESYKDNSNIFPTFWVRLNVFWVVCNPQTAVSHVLCIQTEEQVPAHSRPRTHFYTRVTVPMTSARFPYKAARWAGRFPSAGQSQRAFERIDVRWRTSGFRWRAYAEEPQHCPPLYTNTRTRTPAHPHTHAHAHRHTTKLNKPG